MKIVATIARYLLGLMFLVFGSNMFLNFIPMGPMPTGVAGQFTVALFAAHYFYVVGAIIVQHPYVSFPDEPERYWAGRLCDAALVAGRLGASDRVCKAVCGAA
jgi:hypothetical protein